MRAILVPITPLGGNHIATLYTQKQINDVLKELRIKPEEGMVTTREAARILSWRAKAEQGIEHEYPDTAIRRHVQLGHLTPYPVSTRFNKYKVEDIFDLPLSPKRGLQQRKMTPPPADSEK